MTAPRIRKPSIVRAAAAASAALILASALACAPAIRRSGDAPPTAAQLAELWVEPRDLRERDLFHGPGGRALAPDPDERYRVTEEDTTGFSRGYDVVDSKGRTWKVKLGEEVQPEVVASRLVWAVGYHQPPTYYVPSIRLEGGRPEHQGQPARLRAEFGYDKEDEWSWHENPFVGTRELHGLLVVNLLINNWDLKASQNRIYEMDSPRERPQRRYVVQDLGASLGLTAWPTGNRNDIDSFEQQDLIRDVSAKGITFDYSARHQELFRPITAADAVWACRLLDQLTDEQWDDLFRAADYPPDVSRRYIRKLKSKINEGLALSEAPRAASRTP